MVSLSADLNVVVRCDERWKVGFEADKDMVDMVNTVEMIEVVEMVVEVWSWAGRLAVAVWRSTTAPN